MLAQVDEVQAREDAATKEAAGEADAAGAGRPQAGKFEAEEPTAPNPTAPKPGRPVEVNEVSEESASPTTVSGPADTPSAAGDAEPAPAAEVVAEEEPASDSAARPKSGAGTEGAETAVSESVSGSAALGDKSTVTGSSDAGSSAGTSNAVGASGAVGVGEAPATSGAAKSAGVAEVTETPVVTDTSTEATDVPKKKTPPAVSAAATLPGAKGSQGAGYARDRFAMMVGARVLRKEKLPYANALEIGAGATFGFSLGLLQSGVVGRLWISDLATSALVAARRRSEQYGLRIQGDELADPELLPFPDGKFDLVVAHALLHRRMDPASTLTEMLRVLKPGGRFVITGESTRAKDWASPGFARAQGSVGRVGMSRAGKARTRLPERLRALTGAPDAPVPVPDQLQALAAEAGAREVKVKPEELLATVLPYPGAEPAPVVVRSRQRLSMVDRKLSQVLPPSAFPTVGITGIR
ncbi:methyltransferase domain-containing protein [Kineosporia sp. NBRC 101677]|uniref:methyltransferase domain-containing protein n=1 Tax=Kineosporia sp. NBRC 101677 TaxID=3032197 RepID=UPI002556665B|nr:methyltransferase domain-containing protein [Kineosporia sp. NBRC 101677]